MKFYIPYWLYRKIWKIRLWFCEKTHPQSPYPYFELRPIKTKCPNCGKTMELDVEENCCGNCGYFVCGVCGSVKFSSYRAWEAIIDNIECSECGQEIQGA